MYTLKTASKMTVIRGYVDVCQLLNKPLYRPAFKYTPVLVDNLVWFGLIHYSALSAAKAM